MRLLDSLDFETLAASSGAEALQLLGTGVKIDVVLTDLAMPEMSGVELTRIIRVDNPALPVILVTGYRSPKIFLSLAMIRYFRSPSPTKSCSRRSLRR